MPPRRAGLHETLIKQRNRKALEMVERMGTRVTRPFRLSIEVRQSGVAGVEAG